MSPCSNSSLRGGAEVMRLSSNSPRLRLWNCARGHTPSHRSAAELAQATAFHGALRIRSFGWGKPPFMRVNEKGFWVVS